MSNEAATASDAGSPVHELVRQRDLLRGWIAKLDEVKTDAPSRVAERVRADYEERLRRVTDELAGHRGAVERDLEERRAGLARAEEARMSAAEALDEVRLRHLIGELDEGAWEEQRPALEGAVSSAEEEVNRIRDEVDRLSALAGEIAGAAEEPPAPEPEPATAESPSAETPSADAPSAEAGLGTDVDAEDEFEPEIAFADEEPSSAPAAESPAAPSEGAPSGEELAAWISEVEAGASEPEPASEAAPAADEDATVEEPAAPGGGGADDWDPFAGEFGPPKPAAPAEPAKPASEDLPWLVSIDQAAGTGGGQGAADELDFLKAIDTNPESPSGDLAEDDLAFLEELDRAISGGSGAGKGGSPAPSAGPAAGLLSNNDLTQAPAPPTSGEKGRAVLCKECGAINEPQAWYCEVCGSEL
jgi:hypothetical protein